MINLIRPSTILCTNWGCSSNHRAFAIHVGCTGIVSLSFYGKMYSMYSNNNLIYINPDPTFLSYLTSFACVNLSQISNQVFILIILTCSTHVPVVLCVCSKDMTFLLSNSCLLTFESYHIIRLCIWIILTFYIIDLKHKAFT